MINYRYVCRQLGLLTFVLTGSMLLVTLLTIQWLGATHTEWAAERAMFITVALGGVIGVALWLAGRGGQQFLGRRDALLLVALSWLLGAALAGLPFWFWALLGGQATAGHPFHSFIDCYFEAMSGLTTTGATVLGRIEPGAGFATPPRGLLLWRATTHWLGGLGIVVLFVAVLPTLGVGGKRLFQVEAPGPAAPGVRPRIAEAARALWLIYVGLTCAEVLLLRLAGLSFFDAVCHTFATLATGGFSTWNASVGHFRSATVDAIIVLFMVLAGVNFAVYHQLIRRDFRRAWSDPEWRLYVCVLVGASVVIASRLHGARIFTTHGEVIDAAGLGDALRYGVFQVVSIQTTTGFCTADFDRWDVLSKAVLVAVMFVGASAGSTGGGIKVIRCLISFKVILAEVERVFRPNVVRTVRVGRLSVDPDQRQGAIVYVLCVLLLFAGGTLVLLLCETDLSFTTAATATAATLNNIGPGLARVGALQNYGWFGAPAKLVLCLLMVLGRLEVFAIFVLFRPSFWRGE